MLTSYQLIWFQRANGLTLALNIHATNNNLWNSEFCTDPTCRGVVCFDIPGDEFFSFCSCGGVYGGGVFCFVVSGVAGLVYVVGYSFVCVVLCWSGYADGCGGVPEFEEEAGFGYDYAVGFFGDLYCFAECDFYGFWG